MYLYLLYSFYYSKVAVNLSFTLIYLEKSMYLYGYTTLMFIIPLININNSHNVILSDIKYSELSNRYLLKSII